MTSVPGSSSAWKTRLSFGLPRDIALLAWAMTIFTLGGGMYANFWSIFVEELGASPSQVGLIIGLQGLARLAAMLPSGIAADRYSRRRIIWIGTAISVPNVLVFLIADSWWQLLPGVFLGFFVSGTVPSLSSYIADASSPRQRARSFTMVYTIGPSAALIISPLIGGWLSNKTSLQFLFLPTAILFGISTAVFWMIAERPHPPKADEPDVSYLDALRDRTVLTASLLQMAILFVLTMGITFLPNYLKDVHGASISTIGRLSAISAVGSILLSSAVGRKHWLTPTRSIAVSCGCIGMVSFLVLLTGNIWFIGAVFLMRGGFSVAWSLFAAVLGDTVPRRLHGRAFAMAEFLGGIGFASAPFVAGTLYERDPALPLMVTAACVPFLLVATYVFERRVVAPATAVQTALA